jgi:integrase
MKKITLYAGDRRVRIYDRRDREPDYNGGKPIVVDYFDLDNKRKSPGYPTLDDAMRAFTTFKKELDGGNHTSVNLTFADANAKWLASKQEDHIVGGPNGGMGGGCLGHYECASAQIVARIGKVKMKNLLDGKLVQKLINERAKETKIGHKLWNTVIKQTLEHHGLMLRVRLKFPKGRQGKIRVPTWEELMRLWYAMSDRRFGQRECSFEYTIAIVMFALFELMRRGEICGLEWPDINCPLPGWIRIRNNYSCTAMRKNGKMVAGLKDPKTGAGKRDFRIHGYTAHVIENMLWLRQAKPTSGFVLPSARGGSLYHTIYEDYWFRLMEYAGLIKEDETNPEPGHMVPLFHFHALRHTGASLLKAMGASDLEITQKIGHSEPATTAKLYYHLIDGGPNTITKAMEDMFALFSKHSLTLPSQTLQQDCNTKMLELQTPYKTIS